MKLPQMVIEKERVFWLAIITTIGFSFLFSIVINFHSDFIGKYFVFSFFYLFLNVLYSMFFIFFSIFIVIIVIYLFFTKGIDEILDNCLLPLIRKYKTFFLWLTFITFFMFIVLNFILIFSFNFDEPQNFISLVEKRVFEFFVLLGALFFEILLLTILGITMPPKLSSSLAGIIAPEDIVKDPTSVINKSFGYFESELRRKLNEYDEKVNIRSLIHKAFNEDKGCFTSPSIQTTGQKDRWRGMVELMTGMYAHYRNPLAHGQLDFNEREMARVILTLLDKSMRFLDEVEEEQS